uniref:Uncharacterized protein n=1 Tax=Molossus molossus TaxID=27622 RepID=A0A7J8DPV7_MOLMO|nr:hypothetical protein HJG59_009229 [Molossus molossus]
MVKDAADFSLEHSLHNFSWNFQASETLPCGRGFRQPPKPAEARVAHGPPRGPQQATASQAQVRSCHSELGAGWPHGHLSAGPPQGEGLADASVSSHQPVSPELSCHCRWLMNSRVAQSPQANLLAPNVKDRWPRDTHAHIQGHGTGTRTLMHMCTSTFMHAHKQARMHIQHCEHVYRCAYMHAHRCVCVYTCTYVHTHAQSPL